MNRLFGASKKEEAPPPPPEKKEEKPEEPQPAKPKPSLDDQSKRVINSLVSYRTKYVNYPRL